MAATKYHTLSPDLTAGELSITLYARQHDSWLGTAEQLTEAGLIPAGFEWPRRTERKSFTHNGIDCGIQRKPLPGGPRGRSWVGVDNWHLMRYCEDRGSGGILYEKQQALKHELWRRSPEGGRMFKRYWNAHEDSQFQAFKRRLLGIPAGSTAKHSTRREA